MLDITILTVGETKEHSFKDLEKKYLTFMSGYAKTKMISVKSEPFSSPNERERIQKIESERLLSKLPGNGRTILLTEHGKTFDSPTFSKQLIKWSEHESNPLTFIFAGPLGPHPTLIERADVQLSLSPLTMPHELSLIVLLEQLYRAGTILNGKTYHY